MKIGEIIDIAISRLGVVDADIRAVALQFARARLAWIWKSKPWRDSFAIGSTYRFRLMSKAALEVSSPSLVPEQDRYYDSPDLILPPDVDKVYSIWTADKLFRYENVLFAAMSGRYVKGGLAFTDLGWFGLPVPYPDWEEHGLSVSIGAVSQGQESNVTLKVTTNLRSLDLALGSSVSIKLISSYDTATSFGYLEAGVLDGYRKISGQDAYPFTSRERPYHLERIISITKPATIYPVELRIVYNAPNVTARYHVGSAILPTSPFKYSNRLLRLHTIPAETKLNYVAKLKPPQITEDSDNPLPATDEALIAAVLADLLERNREYQKAALKLNEASLLIENAYREEAQQFESGNRLIPTVDEPNWREVYGL